MGPWRIAAALSGLPAPGHRHSCASSPPATAPPILTLDAAVALALRRSPAAERARQERNAEIASAEREAPRFSPAVSLSGAELLNGPRITFPRGTDGETTVVPRSRSRLELTLETPLFHSGASSAARRSRAAAMAADAGLEQALADLRRDVKHAYFALLAADAGLAVAREGQEQAQAHRRLVDDLVQAGRAMRLDQLQADVEVEQASTAAADAMDARELAAAALNRLLGRPLEGPLSAAPVGEPVPPPEEPAALSAVEQRADVRALAAQVQAAEAGARLARAQAAPSINLTAGYALQTPSAFVARSSWNTGLTLVLPLGMTARTRADAREAAGRAAAARAALEELRQGAALEVKQALHAVRSAQRRRQSAARATVAAEEALRISELRFQTGRATGLELSANRAALNRTRLDGLRALYDWHTGLADLERATGAAVRVPPDE